MALSAASAKYWRKPFTSRLSLLVNFFFNLSRHYPGSVPNVKQLHKSKSNQRNQSISGGGAGGKVLIKPKSRAQKYPAVKEAAALALDILITRYQDVI